MRKLSGPYDPEIARKLEPQSLRAKFGVDRVLNGVHVTDLPEDGRLEVQFIFQTLLGSWFETVNLVSSFSIYKFSQSVYMQICAILSFYSNWRLMGNICPCPAFLKRTPKNQKYVYDVHE